MTNPLPPTSDETVAAPHSPGFFPLSTPLTRPIRLAVCISGGGTTLLNFLKQRDAGRLVADIPLVVASRGDCRGIERARQAGLHCEVVARKSYASTAEFSERIFALCRDFQVDLVTLAGFLSLIQVPEDFEYRVMNVHPALIPSFCGAGYYGHKVHEAVLARGAKVSGCTVHFADNHYDHGPIIVQSAVKVAEDDTADTLAARVFEAECEAYPEAIRLYSAGRLEITAGTVRVHPARFRAGVH
jgi:phosphoribosylglycinamide formyltransferase 1